MTPFIRGSRGQSTVELAIVLPILLMLLIGIVDISLSLNAYLTVTNASREAANYAVVSPAAPAASIAAVAAARIAPLAAASPLICPATPPSPAPRGVCVTVSYIPSGGSTFAPWPSVGGLPTSSPAAQLPVRVDVCYPWSAVTIVIAQFFHGGGTPCTAGLTSDVFFHGTSTMVTTW